MLPTLLMLSVSQARAACTVTRPYPPASLTVPQTTGGGAMFRVAASTDCVRLEFSAGTFSTAMVGGTARLTPAQWSSLVGPRALTFSWTATGWDSAGVATSVTTTNEIDSDHDGWTRTDGDLGTCDRDATRNPDEMDLCDGIDANCDGVETCASMVLSDADAVYTGEAAYDNAGYSVAGAGDVNGDGHADLLVGAFRNDDGATDAGSAYLVLGRATPSALGALSKQIEYAGVASRDSAGWSVAGAGDANGDGYDDILFGAWLNDDGASDAGAAYLVLGGPSPASESLTAADAEYMGVGATNYAGQAVAGAGDVNDDGYADFLVGAWGPDTTYLVLGDPSPADASLSTADAEYTSESGGDDAGRALAGAGDVDADGYDDMLIGAPESSGGAGAAYLVLGSASPASGSLSDADAKYAGESGGQGGWAVAGAGDVDGDGYDDMLVGAPTDPAGGTYAGVVYVVSGSPSPTSASLVDADAIYRGDRDYLYAGISVAGAGDIDQDGHADLLIGTWAFKYAGGAYLVLGALSLASGNISLANAVYGGAVDGDYAGAVAGPGDVDGDGHDDILVGAYANRNRGGDGAGAAYLVLGGGL